MAAFADTVTRLIASLDTEGDLSLSNAVKADWKILPALTEALAEKANLTGKNDAAASAAALNGFLQLINNNFAAAEPFVINQLPAILRAAGNKQNNVRNAAIAVVEALRGKTSPNDVRELLHSCFNASDIENAWQSR